MPKRLQPIEHDNSFREGMTHEGLLEFIVDSCDICRYITLSHSTCFEVGLKFKNSKAFSSAEMNEALDIYFIAGEYAGSDILTHFIRIIPMNKVIDGKILIDAKEWHDIKALINEMEVRLKYSTQ